MIQNTIFRYVLALFDESRDGSLAVGSGLEWMDHDVDWNAEQAVELARQCAELIGCLTELARRPAWQHRSKEQAEIWNTYLRPFPDHDLDRDDLRTVREKEAQGLALNKSEQDLSRHYRRWYEENTLKRLPWKGCAPTNLICCARCYVRLVEWNAPVALQENEARSLAEAFVLYHYMAQSTP